MDPVSLPSFTGILPVEVIREFSSVGSEHLPYKQRVGGSRPSTPTKDLDHSGSFLFRLDVVVTPFAWMIVKCLQATRGFDFVSKEVSMIEFWILK
jgi:hypothetical protein